MKPAELAVMLILLPAAAVLQTLLPPLPGCLLKPPLLPGVAVYYALRRPPQRALVAALWAGVLCDGLGGVPAGVSSCCLAVVAVLLLALRRVLAADSWLTAALAGAAAAPLLAACQAAALRRQWETAPGAGVLLAALLAMAAAGAPAAVAAVAAGQTLDGWAGNLPRKKEIGSRDG